MKQLIKIGLLSQLLCTTPLFALNPIEGFYGGLLGEVSHGPSNDAIVFREDSQIFHGTVDYSPIAGGAGVMLGYKYKHFRLEGEFLYNRISTGPVTVGTCTIQSPNVITPTGVCPAGIYDGFQAKALGYSGSSTAIYGLVNGFWDFFSYEGSSQVTPYIGIGIGMASIKNGSSFINTNTDYSHGQTHSGSGSAHQGILGVSYYMDDFTWCSADYRYLNTTQKANIRDELGSHIPSKSYLLNTFNLTINFAFDKGAL
jgi:opacity protein-like surface antigen